MPQTNKKEEWVQHYKKQLKVFTGKKSGWTVSKSAGSIKLEVRTNGKKNPELYLIDGMNKNLQ